MEIPFIDQFELFSDSDDIWVTAISNLNATEKRAYLTRLLNRVSLIKSKHAYFWIRSAYPKFPSARILRAQIGTIQR